MRRSLNEIEQSLRKAAIGAGFATGLAEDAGRAGAWLAALGHDGVAAVLSSIEPGASIARAHKDAGAWVFPEARAAVAGPSALDLIAADPDDKPIRLDGVDSPLMLVGLSAGASADYRVAIRLAFAHSTQVLVTTHGAKFDGPVPQPGIDVTLTTAELIESPAAASLRQWSDEVCVDDTLWRKVEALASKTYVPSNEASRAKGAGAGLRDND